MAGTVGMGRGAYALVLVFGLIACFLAALFSGAAGLLFSLSFLLLHPFASGARLANAGLRLTTTFPLVFCLFFGSPIVGVFYGDLVAGARNAEYPGIAEVMYAALFFVVAMLLLAVACVLLPTADGDLRSLPSLLRTLIREITAPARMLGPQPAPKHPPVPKRREGPTWVDTEDGRRLWVDTSNEP